MKREFTNCVRVAMDELVPGAIRDSAWFMWPFFVLAYGTLAVRPFMQFKSRAYAMSDAEYQAFYSSLGNSVSRRRETDLNEASIRFILDGLPQEDAASVLDVGAGNGYLLGRLARERPWRRLAGVDVVQRENAGAQVEYHAGLLPSLPFADHEFDVVTCTHVIEHVLDVEAAVRELLRVTRRRLFVVVPRQRYFYYTLDEHLNFYPRIEPLLRFFRPHRVACSKRGGDWALAVDVGRD